MHFAKRFIGGGFAFLILAVACVAQSKATGY